MIPPVRPTGSSPACSYVPWLSRDTTGCGSGPTAVLCRAKQDVVAYFYYQMAQFLLDPVDFFASPNLEKLQKEMQAVKPADLPGETRWSVNVNGLSLQITDMRTQDFGGQLDLVIEYKAQGAFDPVSLRSQILALDKAMLARYPGMSTAFHGLWVYAYNANGQPFAIELPMNQIQ